jgi:hypothetical protein
MNYILYPFYVVINLTMTLIAYVIAPILPIFSVQKDGWLDNHSVYGIGPRLPTWLNWFMTPDNSLDGDRTFQQINGRSYWAKVKWLWRNPAYSVCLKYINTIENQTFVKGDDSIRDNDNAKAGLVFVRCAGLFQFVWINPIGGNRCFYLNIGWNIRGTLHMVPVEAYQATFAFSPRISGFR